MTRVLTLTLCAGLLGAGLLAQEAAQPPTATKGTTVIGCLSGPDGDNLYTLSSMQHRLGVEVVGGDELKKGAGAKVKLTGSWEPLPGAEGKKGDAARRFKATDMTVMEEKCQVPAEVTPESKKKQAEQKRAQQQKQQQPAPQQQP